MLTLITPTSDRPQAFALCERWMSRQTYSGPLHWIVVDDGSERTDCTRGQDVIRRPAGEHPHQSFLNNLLAGFRRAESFAAQKVLIIEDDDWYHPGYLQQMSDWLEDADVVGQGRARYYNIQSRRCKEMGNRRHCSLCQTGVTGRVLPWIIQWVESGHATKVLDMEIWKHALGAFRRMIDTDGSTLSCGIKGLPGKGGLGYGHRMHRGEPTDHDGRVLRRWIGDEDAAMLENYREAG